MRHIELLAPAKNADVGIVAISHGADAVYIGADAFSARAAAGNSVADIKRLADYGHTYGAKTIVALNTILNNEELRKAEGLIWELYEAGVDALIIQDLGLLTLNLPPIPLHASTQTDNRTVEKVRLMHDLGMTRVVMARELSVDEIRAIHEAVPDVELECFVHGALCVCYSGQCYMSAAMTGRSANRGECAQPCRLPMELYGADKLSLAAQGQGLLAQGHLLSLRDMNRSAYISNLIDAGVTSLKIEGRLKDASYVKNVVAYYRQAIDKAIEGREEYGTASITSRYTYTFTPQLDKSFNRGFTDYFADGERKPMWNWKSPKSMGEKVGTISKIGKDSFVVSLTLTAASGSAAVELHNGDGLAVGDMGFRLNRVEGNTCYPLGGAEVCRQLKPKMPLNRNLDIKFEQLLDKPSADRRMPVTMAFESTPDKVTLRMELTSALGNAIGSISAIGTIGAQCEVDGAFESSDKPQEENIRKQLSKLGNTPFTCDALSVKGDRFVPSSVLSELRRQTVAKLQDSVKEMLDADRQGFSKPDYQERASKLSAEGILPATYLANVMNASARKVYGLMGIDDVAQAFELQQDKGAMVMQTKHCLKYALGQCKRFRNPNPEKSLNDAERLGDEAILKIGKNTFLVKFGCANSCVSQIFKKE